MSESNAMELAKEMILVVQLVKRAKALNPSLKYDNCNKLKDGKWRIVMYSKYERKDGSRRRYTIIMDSEGNFLDGWSGVIPK